MFACIVDDHDAGPYWSRDFAPSSPPSSGSVSAAAAAASCKTLSCCGVMNYSSSDGGWGPRKGANNSTGVLKIYAVEDRESVCVFIDE